MSVTTAVNINQRSLKIKLSGLDLENESGVNHGHGRSLLISLFRDDV